MGFRHEARLFFWGERKKTAEERRLIIKIDCAVGPASPAVLSLPLLHLALSSDSGYARLADAPCSARCYRRSCLTSALTVRTLPPQSSTEVAARSRTRPCTAVGSGLHFGAPTSIATLLANDRLLRLRMLTTSSASPLRLVQLPVSLPPPDTPWYRLRPA
jgi:hypothetical protein